APAPLSVSTAPGAGGAAWTPRSRVPPPPPRSSGPRPPSSVSLPLPPSRRSAPAEPVRPSLPPAPLSVSLPVSELSESAPPPPFTVSFVARPAPTLTLSFRSEVLTIVRVTPAAGQLALVPVTAQPPTPSPSPIDATPGSADEERRATRRGQRTRVGPIRAGRVDQLRTVEPHRGCRGERGHDCRRGHRREGDGEDGRESTASRTGHRASRFVGAEALHGPSLPLCDSAWRRP